jgi:hypothetical protein
MKTIMKGKATEIIKRHRAKSDENLSVLDSQCSYINQTFLNTYSFSLEKGIKWKLEIALKKEAKYEIEK